MVVSNYFIRLKIMVMRLFLLLSVVSTAWASSPLPKRIIQYGCQSCHDLAYSRSAPSFQSIAARYEHSSDAAKNLAIKLRRGTVGSWGAVSMPPQIMVPDSDLLPVIEWVLAQKKTPAK